MGWGELTELGVGTSGQVEEAQKALDSIGVRPGKLAPRALILVEEVVKTKEPYVLLDVDGVCVDYEGHPMPGICRLVATLQALGFGIVLWSAGGAEYCREVAAACGFSILAAYDKPDYPIQYGEAMALLVRPPALQVDDDATERVGGWPFMHLTEAQEMADYQMTRCGAKEGER